MSLLWPLTGFWRSGSPCHQAPVCRPRKVTLGCGNQVWLLTGKGAGGLTTQALPPCPSPRPALLSIFCAALVPLLQHQNSAANPGGSQRWHKKFRDHMATLLSLPPQGIPGILTIFLDGVSQTLPDIRRWGLILGWYGGPWAPTGRTRSKFSGPCSLAPLRGLFWKLRRVCPASHCSPQADGTGQRQPLSSSRLVAETMGPVRMQMGCPLFKKQGKRCS